MSADVLDLPITSSATEAENSLRDELPSVGPVICYRDPADVRTIRRQSWLIIISFVIAAVAVVGVVYKAIQRPDRIVVDMSSGRTVMINDRELGATGKLCVLKKTSCKSPTWTARRSPLAQRYETTIKN